MEPLSQTWQLEDEIDRTPCIREAHRLDMHRYDYIVTREFKPLAQLICVVPYCLRDLSPSGREWLTACIMDIRTMLCERVPSSRAMALACLNRLRRAFPQHHTNLKLLILLTPPLSDLL